MSRNEDELRYHVVKNHEEQFSIWLEGKPLPHGWASTGFCGLKSECLSRISSEWTDLRPLSLRNRMNAAGPEGRG
jgi:MbtH protein